jgi:hypothetical protein
MKHVLSTMLFFFAIAAPPCMSAEDKLPKLTSVTPDSGKAETVFVATGENVGKKAVSGLYLTAGKDDIKVEILVQKDDSIQFKAPGATKAGRYSLMVLSADGKQFIEQPVKVEIE